MDKRALKSQGPRGCAGLGYGTTDGSA